HSPQERLRRASPLWRGVTLPTGPRPRRLPGSPTPSPIVLRQARFRSRWRKGRERRARPARTGAELPRLERSPRKTPKGAQPGARQRLSAWRRLDVAVINAHLAKVLIGVNQLGTLLSVVIIDVVLAGDNAIVVGMAAAGLPAHRRRTVITLGIAAAT